MYFGLNYHLSAQDYQTPLIFYPREVLGGSRMGSGMKDVRGGALHRPNTLSGSIRYVIRIRIGYAVVNDQTTTKRSKVKNRKQMGPDSYVPTTMSCFSTTYKPQFYK